MVTQVSFTTDEELKNMALEKAKNEGITLKALLVGAMRDFVDGKISFGIIPHSEPDVEEIVFIDEAINKKAATVARLLK
jgi:hypothetical protein